MSFPDFLAQPFDWSALAFIGTILLGLAFVVGGIFAAFIGGFYFADEHHWLWNLLYLPAIAALALLGLLFALWLGTEVVGR